jgi:hypothetical protein
MASSKSLDVATVLAISAVVYVTASICHEGLGHGLAALLVGGKPLAVSTSWFSWDHAGVGPWAVRAVAAAGTVANALMGALLLGPLYAFSARSGNWYYFCWLGAGVNLFMAGGYLMTSPLFGFGDWQEFVRDLWPELVWRIGLITLGGVISGGALLLLVERAAPLLGSDSAERMRRARLLCWLPYLAAGGVLMTASALVNSEGPIYVISSALASLGGTAFLPWLTTWIRDPQSTAANEPLPILRSWGWVTAGSVAALLSLTILGYGVPF